MPFPVSWARTKYTDTIDSVNRVHPMFCSIFLMIDIFISSYMCKITDSNNQSGTLAFRNKTKEKTPARSEGRSRLGLLPDGFWQFWNPVFIGRDALFFGYTFVVRGVFSNSHVDEPEIVAIHHDID